MENTRIVEAQRKTNLKANELELFKQSFVIVPYQVSGFIDYTNRGASNRPLNPDDFETFKRVWTGNDACVINWKNSIYLVQNKETKEMEIKFQLGECFLGAMETNYNENVIAKDVSFSEYTSQELVKTLTFRVNAKMFEITDYYHFMFYKIPEISGSTLYRIESIEKDFVGRELVDYVITFKTINQELANTGRARQQNIMPNSPGQGYLECVVKDSNWPEELGDKWNDLVEGRDYYKFFDRYITADFQKQKNRPVQKAIFRLLGNGILNAVVLEGRPVLLGDSFTKYRPQRLIFPYELQQPTTPNLFNSQLNSNNMYFGDFSPTLEYFKDLMKSIKDSLTPVNQWSYQGWLTYNYDDLKATNPKDDGAFKYEIFGRVYSTLSDVVKEQWEFETPTKNIDTTGIYGCEKLYRVGGNKYLHNHLFDNFWTQKMIKVLPIDVRNTLTFGWSFSTALSVLSFGVIGLIAGGVLAAIGISGTLATKLKAKKLQSFRGIINAPFLDFNNDLFKETDNLGNKIPFNFFDSDNNTPSNIFFDSSTLQTSFECSLTNLFTTPRVLNSDDSLVVLDTLNIGQTKYENGEYIFPSKAQLLLNGDASLYKAYSSYGGYIIDGFKIQAVGKCDIQVEFLDGNDEVVWSGVYQSEAKWSGSLREIWTEKNCSVFGRENVFFTEPLPYPGEIPEPPVSIPIGSNFETDGAYVWYFNDGVDPLLGNVDRYLQYINGACTGSSSCDWGGDLWICGTTIETYNLHTGPTTYDDSYFEIDLLKNVDFIKDKWTFDNLIDNYDNMNITFMEPNCSKRKVIKRLGSSDFPKVTTWDLVNEKQYVIKMSDFKTRAEFDESTLTYTYEFDLGEGGVKKYYDANEGALWVNNAWTKIYLELKIGIDEKIKSFVLKSSAFNRGGGSSNVIYGTWQPVQSRPDLKYDYRLPENGALFSVIGGLYYYFLFFEKILWYISNFKVGIKKIRFEVK